MAGWDERITMIEFYEDGAVEEIGVGVNVPLAGPKKWIGVYAECATWRYHTAYGSREVRGAEGLTAAGVVKLLQKRDPNRIVSVEELGKPLVWYVGTVRVTYGRPGGHRVYCPTCDWEGIGTLRFAAGHQNDHERDRSTGVVSTEDVVRPRRVALS